MGFREFHKGRCIKIRPDPTTKPVKSNQGITFLQFWEIRSSQLPDFPPAVHVRSYPVGGHCLAHLRLLAVRACVVSSPPELLPLTSHRPISNSL